MIRAWWGASLTTVVFAAAPLAAQQPGAPRPAAPAPAAQSPAPANRPAAPAAPTPGAANRPAPATAQTPARPPQDTVTPIDYRREIFNYQGAQRDPFQSLVSEASTQTTVADLRLVSVIYDARGGRSVAVVRERNNPRPYRLRRGDQIGRLRVIQIRPYEIVFQVEEFGFERQEVLTLTRPEVNR